MADATSKPIDPKRPEPPMSENNVDSEKRTSDASAQLSSEKAETKQRQQPDPMQHLVDRLQQVRDDVSLVSKPLADSIRSLSEGDPSRLQDPAFRTRAAQVLQDVERVLPNRLEVPPELRQEMADRATTMPGLQNERMRALMEQTQAVESRRMAAEIRAAAAFVVREADQHSPAAESRIDALESKLRVSPRPAAEASASAQAAGVAEKATPDKPGAQTDPSRGPPPNSATANPQAGNPKAQQSPGPTAEARPQPEEVRVGLRGGGAAFRILSALEARPKDGPAPWDAEPSPFGERISRFKQSIQLGHEGHLINTAETSARAAIEAVRDLGTGPGTAVMARIQEAARQDKDGMPGVLSEMRAGGRYSELRQEFDGALAREKNFAAAYDRAASAIERYSGDRAAVEQIAAPRADYAQIKARFEKVDAEIGQAAGVIPGRTEGQSLLEETAKKAAEIMERAVAAIRNAAASVVGASPSSSPGPGPG